MAGHPCPLAASAALLAAAAVLAVSVAFGGWALARYDVSQE